MYAVTDDIYRFSSHVQHSWWCLQIFMVLMVFADFRGGGGVCRFSWCWWCLQIFMVLVVFADFHVVGGVCRFSWWWWYLQIFMVDKVDDGICRFLLPCSR